MTVLSNVVVVILTIIIKIETRSVLYANVNDNPEKLERIECDTSSSRSYSKDGIVTDKNKTPWLGLLIVYITEFQQKQTAVTGLVLVKHNYAIGNAHDIAKIPEFLLPKSEAVFTPAKSGMLRFKVGKPTVHREYKNEHHNTLAIIEILEDEFSLRALKPICLLSTESRHLYFTSDDFQTFGYTDKRGGKLDQETSQLIEIDESKCIKYYKRNALASSKLWPTKYYCCQEVPKNKTKACIYENGMALASQHVAGRKGVWVLLGISAKGPGCSAPSRFINVVPYMKWINKVLRRDERLPEESMEILDVKDFPVPSGRRSESTEKAYQRESLNEYYKIVDFDRVSDTELLLFIFNETYEMRKGACSNKHRKKLFYRENTTIEALPGKVGIGAYKISLYDMLIKGYTCVNISVNIKKLLLVCEQRSVAQLYYTIGLDDKEDNEDLFDQKYVLDTRNYTRAVFLNVYVRFVFRGRADLRLEFFGPKQKTIRDYYLVEHPKMLLNLLENKYWTKYLNEERKTPYKEPRGYFAKTTTTTTTPPPPKLQFGPGGLGVPGGHVGQGGLGVPGGHVEQGGLGVPGGHVGQGVPGGQKGHGTPVGPLTDGTRPMSDFWGQPITTRPWPPITTVTPVWTLSDGRTPVTDKYGRPVGMLSQPPDPPYPH